MASMAIEPQGSGSNSSKHANVSKMECVGVGQGGGDGDDDDAVLADEIIALLFYNPNSKSNPEVLVTIPEFTHQLFDEEVVDTLQDPYEHRLVYRINCQDLSHTIFFNKDFTKLDIENTLKKLQKVTPHGTNHFRLSKWEEYEVTKEVKRLIMKHKGVVPAMIEGGLVLDTGTMNYNKSLPSTLSSLSPTIAIASAGVASDVNKFHSCGVLIEEFERNEFTYSIRLASNKDPYAAELLSRFENLAVWFIETADPVDFKNDDKWEVLFLFRRLSVAVEESESVTESKSEDWIAVGYMTLYSFRNPVRGGILRVCQALILPFAQRLGLGQKMLGSIYENIVMRRPEVAEVNVEDPADGFKKMRDRVDVTWTMKYLYENPSVNIGELRIDSISSELKINLDQSQFVKDTIQFHKLNCQLINCNMDMSSINYDTDSTFLRYRLSIKKRLLRNAHKYGIKTHYPTSSSLSSFSFSFSSSSSTQPRSGAQSPLPREDIVSQLSVKFNEMVARMKSIPYNAIASSLESGQPLF